MQYHLFQLPMKVRICDIADPFGCYEFRPLLEADGRKLAPQTKRAQSDLSRVN